jgi:alkylation response protein AidB-like acyl-CoA dehydrogenase
VSTLSCGSVQVDSVTILKNVKGVAEQFARARSERQRRRELDQSDFDALKNAGFLLTGVPVEHGGIWEDVGASTRPVCEILRTLAHGDPVGRLGLFDAPHGSRILVGFTQGPGGVSGSMG